MTISLKPLDRKDKDGWLELWQRFLENCVENASAHLTFLTFDKLVTKEHPLRSRIALDENQRIVGFIHDFLNVSTWQTREICFIDDLYVAKVLGGNSLMMLPALQALTAGAACTW